MKVQTLMGIAVLGVTLALTGCTEQMMNTKSTDASLYHRLGGKPAITAVVDDFVGRVAKDTRINGRFANANIPRLKMRLVEQICQASGGPCTYSGRDMKTAHAGMGITNADFEALVENLVASLNKYNVGKQEQEELLSTLSSMQKDIVERS
jgi:hemoglobin